MTRLLAPLPWRFWWVVATFATVLAAALPAQIPSGSRLPGTDKSDSVTLRESGDTVTLFIWRPAGIVDTALFRVQSDSVWRLRPRPTFLPPPVGTLVRMYIDEKREAAKIRKRLPRGGRGT